jgi:ParB/RepB/Spo0J family partition protein
MPQLTTKPVTFFKPDAKQARQHYDEGEDRSLGESMQALGQLQPVGAKPDGTMLWGHRRLRAALLVGLKELQVIITDKPLSDSDVRIIQLTENMQRSDLSGVEQWRGCAELMCMNPHWAMKDLAEHLHLDPSMVTRLLSPSKCISAVQEALAEGKIGISDCYALSKADEREQARLLALKLAGASRDAIEQAGRKSRNGKAAALKVTRIRCPVNGGAVVQVSGKSLDLDDAIEAAQEWVKEAKKASEQGLDARTFERVCRDKAKRGGQQ